MARQLYATEFVQLAGSANPAPNLPFTVWTDLTAGSNVTSQIVGPDGSSAYTATTDSQGNIAPFRGPDGYLGNLFVDTGAAYRFMLDSPSLLDYLVSNVGVGGTGGGVTDHGALSGLLDDDHPQYHTDARGDARYYTKAQADTNVTNAVTTSSTADRLRANHSGTQIAATISDFASATQAVTGAGSAFDGTLLHKAGAAETVSKVVNFTTSPTVPTPVNPTDAANRAFVLANAGGGGGSVASVQTYEIPAAQLQVFPASATEAQKLAVVNANTSVVKAAMTSHPGMKIVLDPSQAWPLQVALDEINDSSFAAGLDYALAGRVVIVRGTRTSATDVTSGRIVARPPVSITRKAGTPFSPVNLRNTVQVGPNLPNTGAIFTSVCSGFEVPSGYNRFKSGQLIHLCSNDSYAWAARAGYAFIAKASFFPVAGILVTISGMSYAALSTAMGSTQDTVERMTVVGASSGTTAIVAGDIGSGQIVVDKMSGDFTAGETIREQTTNATLGTFSLATVIMSGTLNTTYPTTPTMRIVTRSSVDLSGLSIEVDGDPDDFIAAWNRTDAASLIGCTDVNLRGVTIRSGYAAGVVLRSCWNVRADVKIDALPNHALENGQSEGAYGYGVRALGCTDNFDVKVNITYGRHAFTSNGIGGTWNATGTNYWTYGPGARNGRITGMARAMWGTCWDTHEGAEDLLFDGVVGIDPMSAARSTTSPDGITLRGFNITVLNPWFRGVRQGISEQAIALDAGGLIWTNRIIGGLVEDFQSVGYGQNEDADFDSQSRFLIKGTTFRGDPKIAAGTYNQSGLILRRGNTHTEDVRIESVNTSMVRHTSFVGTGSTGVGRVTHKNLTLDWTDSTATRGITVEATYASVDVIGAHYLINPVSGTQKPFFYFVNTAGNTPIRYRGLSSSYLSSTTAEPALVSITGGTPVLTRIADVGESTGGGGASGTQVTIDGVAQTSLDISSTPVVQMLSISADIAGPAAGATISNLSQFQTTLAPGNYLVKAVLDTTASAISAGALRFGLGGPGAGGASITNVAVFQNTNTNTAPNVNYLNVLGTSGTTATTTTGSANVIGLSPGVANTQLPWVIDGRLLVTTAGTLGLTWQLSTGATATMALKAGSYITFTKVS